MGILEYNIRLDDYLGDKWDKVGCIWDWCFVWVWFVLCTCIDEVMMHVGVQACKRGHHLYVFMIWDGNDMNGMSCLEYVSFGMGRYPQVGI